MMMKTISFVIMAFLFSWQDKENAHRVLNATPVVHTRTIITDESGEKTHGGKRRIKKHHPTE